MEEKLAEWIAANRAKGMIVLLVPGDHRQNDVTRALLSLPNTFWAWRTDYKAKKFRNDFDIDKPERSQNISLRGARFPTSSVVFCEDCNATNFGEIIPLLVPHCLVDELLVVFILRFTEQTQLYVESQCANFPVFHLRRLIEEPVGSAPAAAGGTTANPCLVEPGLPALEV